MKKKIFTLLLSLLVMSVTATYAQEEEEKKEDRPVRKPFESTTLIDHQTVVTPAQGGLEFMIYHRFGDFSNGIKDLWGIYAPSNIALGINYGLTDKIMLGFATEKNNKLQEFKLKYSILQQTRSGRIPVSVSFFGNMAIDGREEILFGQDYEFINRMTYFGQLIVSRKINNNASLLASASFSHINAVDSVYQNDKIGLSVAGKYAITRSINAIVEYNHPLVINDYQDYQAEIEPGISLGMEIATSTHAFQIFASTYEQIVAQKNFVYNTNRPNSEGYAIGFNITVRL